MSDSSNSIASVVAKLRAERELSQEHLASLAGIHRTYVSQIERGLKSPTLAVLFRISKALNLQASEIVRQMENDID